MANNTRPLSPHLQVYRLPLTGLLSITHRVTGVLLAIGLIVVVYVVSALSSGEQAYVAMQQTMQLAPIKWVYWGFVYALFFHLCHGVRHLIWDTGTSFERGTLNRYAIYELLASLLLTATAFLIF